MKLAAVAELHRLGKRVMMEAGGPGSGKHSEGGEAKWSAHPALHTALLNHGFSHAKSSGIDDDRTSLYTHPKEGNVSTNHNGLWMHTDSGGGHVGGGMGVKSLNQHFS